MLMYWLYFALHQGQNHCRVRNVRLCPCAWDDDYCILTNMNTSQHTTCMNYHWLCLLCSYNYQKQATAAGVFCCVVASFGGSLPFLVPLDLCHALCQFRSHNSLRKISVFCCEGLVKEHIYLLRVRGLLAFLYCCLQIRWATLRTGKRYMWLAFLASDVIHPGLQIPWTTTKTIIDLKLCVWPPTSCIDAHCHTVVIGIFVFGICLSRVLLLSMSFAELILAA